MMKDPLNVPLQHGNCPHCDASLDGDSIWLHFYNEFTVGKGYWKDEQDIYTDKPRMLCHSEAVKAADDVASAYGATRTEGRWGRAIGIYDMNKDRTVEYQCPDCGGRWPRN